MNAVGTHEIGWSAPFQGMRNASSWAKQIPAGLALCALSGGLLAQPLDAGPIDPPDNTPTVAAARLDVTATSVPAFDDPAGQPAQRLDMVLMPSPRSGFGLAAAMTTPVPTNGAPAAPGAPRAHFDLGLQWRHTLASSQRVDITAWRRFTPQPDALALIESRSPEYGARVEMRLKPARAAGLRAEGGFIGLQLQSGARISVRKKEGRPTVTYRVKF